MKTPGEVLFDTHIEHYRKEFPFGSGESMTWEGLSDRGKRIYEKTALKFMGSSYFKASQKTVIAAWDGLSMRSLPSVVHILSDAENSITALNRSVFVLQLVSESHLGKLASRIEELVKTSYANGAIDIAILVSYPDVHALKTNLFFSARFQAELVEDLPIKPCYLLPGDEGGFHICAPEQLSYYAKYMAKGL